MGFQGDKAQDNLGLLKAQDPVMPSSTSAPTSADIEDLLQHSLSLMQKDSVARLYNFKASSESRENNGFDRGVLMQFVLVNQMMKMNASLEELKRKQEEMHRSSILSRRQAARDSRGNDAKQGVRTMAYQITSSGSVVAIFLAALDVALLSYGNDVFSAKFSESQLPISAKFTISCFTFSLVISLAVVLVDIIVTFLQMWQTIAAHNNRTDPNNDIPAPFACLNKFHKPRNSNLESDTVEVDSDYTDSIDDGHQYGVLSEYDIIATLAALATIFNTLLLPALFATIIASTTLSWIAQPRLSSISVVATDAILLILFLSILYSVTRFAIMSRQDVDAVYNKWNREKRGDRGIPGATTSIASLESFGPVGPTSRRFPADAPPGEQA